MVFIKAALLLCFVAAITAHLCLLNPHQRGSMTGINTPGANDCFLIQPLPCGGRWGEVPPRTNYKAGSNVTIMFQKNLDHYNSTKPGYFNISVGNSYPGLHQVGMVKDMGEPSLYIYNATITIPPNPDPWHILQVTYVTNNPQAPAIFYQC